MSEDTTKVRCAICKTKFDGHWRGAVVVSATLRDAGFEVIYLGNQTPEELVSAVIDEDVDVIGLSILTSGYQPYIRRTIELLKKERLEDVLFVVGGIILPEDISILKQMGIDEVFLPGSELNKIVLYITENVGKKAQPLETCGTNYPLDGTGVLSG
jgi:methylmalonyl-CoA mutase C-terminal domain/subunit